MHYKDVIKMYQTWEERYSNISYYNKKDNHFTTLDCGDDVSRHILYDDEDNSCIKIPTFPIDFNKYHSKIAKKLLKIKL